VIDETEAYLRHRARVHEREKREKLKKQGKLDEYLAELERNKAKQEELKKEPKKETEDKAIEEQLVLAKFMEQYNEVKKFEKENLITNIQIKNVEETVTETIVKKKKNRRRKKKKVIEEQDEIILKDAEFKPQLAGNTGLPTFFFSNLVKQNCTALQAAQARHKRNVDNRKKH
jgi:hypothetical protein